MLGKAVMPLIQSSRELLTQSFLIRNWTSIDFWSINCVLVENSMSPPHLYKKKRWRTRVLKEKAMIWVSLMHWLNAATLEGIPGGCLNASRLSLASQYSSSTSSGWSRSKLGEGYELPFDHNYSQRLTLLPLVHRHAQDSHFQVYQALQDARMLVSTIRHLYLAHFGRLSCDGPQHPGPF